MRRGGVAVANLLAAMTLVLAACATNQQNAGQALRKGAVQRGPIDEVVSATGTVFPQERVNLSFQQPGIVRDVFVEVGSFVNAGDPLTSLDTGALDITVRQAELALQAQQLVYDRLSLPPSEAQIATAQAALYSASLAYEKQAQGADPEQVRIAQLQYEQAYNAYLQADMDLRAVQWWAPKDTVDQYRARLGQAIANLEIARLRLEQVRAGPDADALAAAGAAVAQAQANLDRLREGPSDLEIAQAQVQIYQAQIGLERARQQREGAVLAAPFSGVVAAVNVQPGMLAPTTAPAVTVIDAAYLHVEADIDEIDVGQLTPGLPVRVTFDALPSETVQGQLSSLAPSATDNAGAVTYTVRIDVAVGDLPVRSGMTATVDIVVHRLENVLLVPNWAIRIDRSTGQAYASILLGDGTLQEVPVVLGLRAEAESQVIAGLREGQVVAVSLTGQGLDLFGNEGQ